jgi:deoxyhypusine synthase
MIDVSEDHKKIINIVLNSEKTAGIILGGGISKHYILNANIFREGFDYTVYISTAQAYDGSDSGGTPDEAVSWAKIKVHSPRVKVYADASLAFPMLVYAAFVKK